MARPDSVGEGDQMATQVGRQWQPYSAYRDSGVEWFGRIPTHWTSKKIKFLVVPDPVAIKTGPFGSQLLSSEMVAEGEVKVFNQRGAMVIPCRVTVRMMPGVVDIPSGAWWTPDEMGVDRRGAVNVLTSEKLTPFAHGNAQHTIMVQVVKIKRKRRLLGRG